MTMRLQGGLALLLVAGIAGASPKPAAVEDFPAAVAAVSATHAGSVVEVRFVQSSEFGGQTRRQDSVVLGLVVGREGLVIVPERELQPEFRVFDPASPAGDGTTVVRISASDFRVFVAGRSEPLAARYLSRDADRGLAWLQLEGEATPAGIDLAQRCELEPGDRYLGLWRLPARQGGAPTTAPGFVGGRTAAPFPAFTISGPVGPAFALDGRFCGMVVTIDVDPQGGGGRPWQENLLVDSASLSRLTERVRGASGPR